MHILVVEDETLIRMLVCDLLEDAGFTCTEAASAEEALALLDRDLCRPDLLVTDYNLGLGLDGKALAQQVLRRRPGIGIVYVTGNPECFADRPLRTGERLISKPFTPADLIPVIEALANTWQLAAVQAGVVADAWCPALVKAA